MAATGVVPVQDALLALVPRELFVPDVVWVYETDGELRKISKQVDVEQWRAAVAADRPVVTQVNFGAPLCGEHDVWPSSSCSQPGLVAAMLDALDVRAGQAVLEIGTGTGWNAALLCCRVGEHGRVVTIEVDAEIAESARTVLARAGYTPLVVTGDGIDGYLDAAPYDRVVATAAVKETVPSAWIDQLKAGGRLVAPWGTDWSNGVMLTLDAGESGNATGRFSGDLAFMRLRGQRVALWGWEPDDGEVGRAVPGTTECRGSDLDRILNPAKGLFAIGARVPDCFRYVCWDKHGPRHHILELDDGHTRSWAQLDWNLNDPAPFTVRQLGPRKLWDEVEAAYDWWTGHGEPRQDRFGFEVRDGQQWIWLDEPANVVRHVT